MITKSWHVDCFKTILLFDLGDAILPSRPHSNSAAESSGGQGWPPFGGHPKGLSLTAVSTAASSTAAGGRPLPPPKSANFSPPVPGIPTDGGKRKWEAPSESVKTAPSISAI